MFQHKKKYILIAYVVMPTHVHIVLQPLPKTSGWKAWCDYREFYSVEAIEASIKKYSGRRMNMAYGRTGKPFWKSECFDRTVRNNKDLDDLIDYIHGNPVR